MTPRDCTVSANRDQSRFRRGRNMIRRFNFEDEVHQSLACVPMAVRRKLDRVGVKVSLEQWQALAQHERLAVCHLPTDSDEERDTVKTFVEESVKARAGTATKALS